VKNTIISTTDKVIMFVGQTFTGHNHDYKMLKEEFTPDKPWFSDINALLDLGYQGIQKDYEGERIEIPTKKPRKSKANPEPKLSEEAKDKNRELVLGKTIRLEVCKEKPKDNYGRLLAYVYKEKTLINAELLKKGIARILIIPPCGLDKAEKFRLFQKEAMKNKIGLWGKRERAKDFIYASDATKFIGENKAVYGKVISAHKGKKVLFLDLGNNATVSLKIVIFKQDLQNFDDFQINPANYYLDKQIVVYGKIKMYKGFPEIIIGSPSQIEVW